MSFLPDWHQTWTPDEAVSELREFVWRGPGVYYYNDDSLLVYPFQRPSESRSFWGVDVQVGERFEFLVYNGRNVGEVLNSLRPSVPTRGVKR